MNMSGLVCLKKLEPVERLKSKHKAIKRNNKNNKNLGSKYLQNHPKWPEPAASEKKKATKQPVISSWAQYEWFWRYEFFIY